LSNLTTQTDSPRLACNVHALRENLKLMEVS
jgi:hypothetical protein